MRKPRIGIVVGSTREGRFADHPARWLMDIGRARGDLECQLLDLRDFPMPFFNEPGAPLHTPPRNSVAQAWAKALAGFDGYVVVTAEYNHGPTAALKNALDYAYREFNRKPVAFVGYGGVGAARAIEQLRLICIELQMAPIRPAVHITLDPFLAVARSGAKLADYKFLNQGAESMLDDLKWWTKALMQARASKV